MTGTPREPRQAEALYIRDLTRVWGVAQAIIAQGLEPLLAVWPEPATMDSEPGVAPYRQNQSARDGGANGPVADLLASARHGKRARIPAMARGSRPGSFRSDRIDTTTAYNPLLPQPRRRSIASLSDDELRRLWPSLEPDDVRRYAPWATSRDEVRRLGQVSPTAGHAEIEEYVRRSVAAARVSPFATNEAGERRPPVDRFTSRSAFRLQPRYQVPVILGADGLPLPPPPVPQVVSTTTIARQMEWCELALGETVTARHLEPVIAANGARADRWVTRELKRVLGIDPRQDPSVAMQLRQWQQVNVNLIESGVRGAWDGVRLRPMLSDVARVVEQAHAQGVRVEVLAQDIKARFGVSDSRAQLIARDQVLKLNGQLNRSRQQAAGVRQYIWITSRDERVRDEHRDLDGTTQSWDVPTSEGFPGDAPQCRCTASPIIPELE